MTFVQKILSHELPWPVHAYSIENGVQLLTVVAFYRGCRDIPNNL
jgi:hypothetical protein